MCQLELASEMVVTDGGCGHFYQAFSAQIEQLYTEKLILEAILQKAFCAGQM